MSRMHGAIPPLPNTPSWHGAQLKLLLTAALLKCPNIKFQHNLSIYHHCKNKMHTFSQNNEYTVQPVSQEEFGRKK
jgi:hypothetical protein